MAQHSSDADRPGILVTPTPLGPDKKMHDENRMSRIEADIREIKTTIQDLGVQRENLINMSQGFRMIQDELKGIGNRLGDIKAEQDVRRIQSDSNRRGVDELFDRLNTLQSEHDTCTIQGVATDMAWVKWLVMSHTVAITGMLLGILAHYIKS